MANVVYNEVQTVSNTMSYSTDCVLRSLNDALSDSLVTVPNDFSCIRYVMELPGVLDQLIQEMNSIYNIACNIDASFRTMNDSMISANQNLEVSVIKERDRLIY